MINAAEFVFSPIKILVSFPALFPEENRPVHFVKKQETQRWYDDGTFRCHATLCLLLLPGKLTHLVFVEVFINPLKYYLETAFGIPTGWLRAKVIGEKLNHPARIIRQYDVLEGNGFARLRMYAFPVVPWLDKSQTLFLPHPIMVSWQRCKIYVPHIHTHTHIRTQTHSHLLDLTVVLSRDSEFLHMWHSFSGKQIQLNLYLLFFMARILTKTHGKERKKQMEKAEK